MIYTKMPLFVNFQRAKLRIFCECVGILGWKSGGIGGECVTVKAVMLKGKGGGKWFWDKGKIIGNNIGVAPSKIYECIAPVGGHTCLTAGERSEPAD